MVIHILVYPQQPKKWILGCWYCSPVGFRRDQFCDSVRKSGLRSDMEHWERVFPVVHAALGKDYGDEMDA